ncbi:four helix bundle protein [Maribacter sp. ACAM166]|uniref:four helix bundle protein n=1 Tax=Maribacter sp. ACAM166 TaxID=2508996 RepID=UPI0010FD3C15|nr:four helix bundle protein [Maribacter sp. ACAM166]TLP81324.1 four helix bundle protein [Maribacter sp. ACAM166]
MSHRFKELDVWKLSRTFCADIYLLAYKFPKNEKFGITNQLRRASVSIPSNIAEGSSRKSNKDFSRFLEITIGSMYEIETQLLIANDLNFMTSIGLETTLEKLNSILKMTSKFRSTLKVAS